MLRRAILHTTMRAPKRERVECSGLAVVSPFPVFPLFPVSVANDHTRSATEPREATQETQETQKRLLISVDFCRFLSISVISVVSWFPWFPWHRRRRRRAPLSAHTTRRPRYFAPRAAAHAHHTAPSFVVTRPNATCGRVAVGACAIKLARLEEQFGYYNQTKNGSPSGGNAALRPRHRKRARCRQ